MQGFTLATFLLFVATTALSRNSPAPDFCSSDTEIAVFHDKSGKLPLTEALATVRSKESKHSPVMIHYGYTSGSVWLYLKAGKYDGHPDCALDLANPQLDQIDIWKVRDGQFKLATAMGDRFPFENRQLQTANFVFPFRADHDQEWLVRLKSTATMTVPVTVQHRDTYTESATLDYFGHGIFYGFMAFFTFFAIHSFITFKNIAYAVYGFYAAAMLLFFVDRDGIAYQFLWPNAVEWKYFSVRAIASMAMASGVFYYSKILELQNRWIIGLARTYSAIGVALGISVIFLDPGITNVPTILISFFSPILLIILPIVALKKEKIFAPYLLIAGVFSLLGLVAYCFSVTGIITPSFWTNNSMKIATLFEFGFLTVGIHQKIRRLIQKKALHKAVFEVSNMIAHDIQKPLDKMDKFLETANMMNNHEIAGYHRKYAPSIRNDLKKAETILSDLMVMGSASVSDNETQLDKLIPRVCDASYTVDLRYSGPVKGDFFSLSRVFENIILNAKQATNGDPKSRFWIRSSDTATHARITLGNSHSKIDRDDLCNVFSMFFTKSKEQGSGIGLAVADKVVRENGGRLWVESNGFSSTGKVTKNSHTHDYVEFHFELPKGERHEDQTPHLVH